MDVNVDRSPGYFFCLIKLSILPDFLSLISNLRVGSQFGHWLLSECQQVFRYCCSRFTLASNLCSHPVPPTHPCVESCSYKMDWKLQMALSVIPISRLQNGNLQMAIWCNLLSKQFDQKKTRDYSWNNFPYCNNLSHSFSYYQHICFNLWQIYLWCHSWHLYIEFHRFVSRTAYLNDWKWLTSAFSFLLLCFCVFCNRCWFLTLAVRCTCGTVKRWRLLRGK